MNGSERAWVELDLEAVRANARTIRSTSQVQLVAVVKADGYGHGASLIAQAALEGGARALGVATPGEAYALRERGILAPIQVLGSFLDQELPTALAAGVELTVHEAADLERLAQGGRKAGRRLRVHLKVDVGMHRHGVAPRDALSLLDRAAELPHVEVVGLMTHFPCATTPDLEPTLQHTQVFETVVQAARGAGLLPSFVHAAASTALFRHPAARFNQVRSGIALVGLDPGGHIAASGSHLEPALSLRARVTRLKRVKQGQSVGYGARWTPTRDATLAIVGLGYGDGLPYGLTSSGAELLLQGQRCPIVGSVMMDYVLADVTDLPRPTLPGDVATLVGRQGGIGISLEEQASLAGLIPYAFTCGLGRRLARQVRGATSSLRPLDDKALQRAAQVA